MADDKTKRGSPDSKRLNKSEPYEVAYAKRKAAKKAGTKTAATKRKVVAAKKAPARNSAAPKPRAAPKPPKEEKTAENTAPKTMKEADAVDLLTDDHLEVSKLFKQYERMATKSAPAAERQQLAQTICAMLKAHTTLEEEIFYPAARQARVDADLLDEADIEHASAKALIAQIEAGMPADDHYDAKVKVLGDYVTHHVVEEQTEMFPKCRRAAMNLVSLRAAMLSRKASLLPAMGETRFR
ncbi:MAG: hemerythrin domain-containing protein [Caldimonas sp.]